MEILLLALPVICRVLDNSCVIDSVSSHENVIPNSYFSDPGLGLLPDVGSLSPNDETCVRGLRNNLASDSQPLPGSPVGRR
jgi:hypothetical protein